MEFTAEIRVKQAETRLRRILKAVAELKKKKRQPGAEKKNA